MEIGELDVSGQRALVRDGRKAVKLLVKGDLEDFRKFLEFAEVKTIPDAL